MRRGFADRVKIAAMAAIIFTVLAVAGRAVFGLIEEAARAAREGVDVIEPEAVALISLLVWGWIVTVAIIAVVNVWRGNRQ